MTSNRHHPGDSPEGHVPATARRVVAEAITVTRLEARVEREGGAPADRRVEIDGDLFRIGAHPSNELILADPHVSRFHCALSRTESGFRLSDSGSRSGTRLGGVVVRDADLPLPECLIAVGDSVVRIRELGGTRRIGVAPGQCLGALVGASLPMRRLFELVKRVAASDVDVLVEGESGTGKEVCAAEIVRLGARREGPLVIVDCGAVSIDLIESELFGHVRGAFTGAERDREGAFEAADGGTLLLDEIGELPLDMQPKLLRALSSREVRRVGDNRFRKVDVRVIAATNRPMEREVNAGRFREDLYYRLSVLTLRVPPLRERLDDVPLLVAHFLEQRGAPEKASLFTPEVMAEMMRRTYPGNVRELRNHVERMLVFEGRDEEPRGAVAEPVPVNLDLPFKTAKERVIERFEAAYLTELCKWAHGNVAKAARKAEIDRMYAHRLFQRYGIKGGRAFD